MTDDNIDDKPQPLLAHLLELRNRLMWAIGAFFIAFLLCFSFAKPLFNLLVQPFTWAVDWAGMTDRKIELIYTAPQEFFFTQIKIGMFGGLVLAFPMIAAQVYKFVAPGLYKNERGAFLPFLIASPLLFLLGAALVYFFFTPMVMWFFLSMEQVGGTGEASIMLLPKVSEYLGLIMTLIAAFIAAAILTPPDPVSQIGLALPTIILYEIAIYCARLVERQRAARAAVAEADEASAAASDPEGDA